MYTIFFNPGNVPMASFDGTYKFSYFILDPHGIEDRRQSNLAAAPRFLCTVYGIFVPK